MNTAALRAILAKRVMGVPVMVFVFLGTGVLLFFAIRMRSSNGDTPDTPDTTEDVPASDGGPEDDTQQPTFQAIPQVTSVTAVADPVDTTQDPPTPAPASAQGVPPLDHVVQNSRDNTPAELARVYYGTTNADAIAKIRSANTKLTVPYPAGSKVHIPANYRPHYFQATAHINTQYEIAKRNGTTAAQVEALNPHMKFPVKAGTRVRVR